LWDPPLLANGRKSFLTLAFAMLQEGGDVALPRVRVAREIAG
jgi:hypothetical protein